MRRTAPTPSTAPTNALLLMSLLSLEFPEEGGVGNDLCGGEGEPESEWPDTGGGGGDPLDDGGVGLFPELGGGGEGGGVEFSDGGGGEGDCDCSGGDC